MLLIFVVVVVVIRSSMVANAFEIGVWRGVVVDVGSAVIVAAAAA